jgi:Putative adhesin
MVTTRTRPLSPARWVTLVLGGLFALALIAGGTWSLINLLGQVTEEHQVTLTPTSNRITIRSAGDIRITSGGGNEVQVTERIRHSIGRPEVEESSTADGVVLRGDCPWYASNCSVAFTVAIPTGMAVDVHSSAGDIVMTGDATSVRLDSSAGDISATGLRSAQVEARSSAGDVRLSFDIAPQTVTAHSSAGDVRIGLPRVAGGYRAHADTSAGDPRIDVLNDPASDRVIDATSSAGDATIETN